MSALQVENMKNGFFSLFLIFILSYSLVSCAPEGSGGDISAYESPKSENITLEEYSYRGSAYYTVNGNIPEFTDEEKKRTDIFEKYSELDDLGRCGAAYASICEDTMPDTERESIGGVKPSGWHTVKYPNLIPDGKYLYNRCHLIGYQLAGENANEKNLITGTRYLNTVGMLPFENEVADYVRESGNRVLYRVTPVFNGNNLVASGVKMEAWSVEDDGEGVCFNVYCFNVQPGIFIDYTTGKSYTEENKENLDKNGREDIVKGKYGQEKIRKFIINTHTKKFHLSSCADIKNMKKHNKKRYKGTVKSLIKEGYKPCRKCLKNMKSKTRSK